MSPSTELNTCTNTLSHTNFLIVVFLFCLQFGYAETTFHRTVDMIMKRNDREHRAKAIISVYQMCTHIKWFAGVNWLKHSICRDKEMCAKCFRPNIINQWLITASTVASIIHGLHDMKTKPRAMTGEKKNGEWIQEQRDWYSMMWSNEKPQIIRWYFNRMNSVVWHADGLVRASPRFIH